MLHVNQHGISVLLHQIPFVDHHHHAFGFFQDIAGNVGILSGGSLHGIYEQQHHIGSIYGP